jgi:nucleoid-associated protein YgaU
MEATSMNPITKLSLLCIAVLGIVVLGYYMGQSPDTKPQLVGAAPPTLPATPGPVAATPTPSVDDASGTSVEAPATASTDTGAAATPASSREQIPLASVDVQAPPTPPATPADAGTTTAAETAPKSTPPPTLNIGEPAPQQINLDQPAGTTPPDNATNPANIETKKTEPAPAPGSNGTAQREPAPAAAKPATYTVQAGETFSAIAQKLYGNENNWVFIAQANPDIDPKHLQPGQVIHLPDLERDGPPQKDDPKRTEGKKVHVVKPGESLSSIARQEFGDPGLWTTIFNANREVLGINPDRLHVGMKLIIPDPPARKPTAN